MTFDEISCEELYNDAEWEEFMEILLLESINGELQELGNHLPDNLVAISY